MNNPTQQFFQEVVLSPCVSICMNTNFVDEDNKKSEAMSLNALRASLYVNAIKSLRPCVSIWCVSIYMTIILYNIILHIETHGSRGATL